MASHTSGLALLGSLPYTDTLSDDGSTVREDSNDADLSMQDDSFEGGGGPPNGLIPLCCRRVAAPPTFEALLDRRMRWVLSAADGPTG